MKLDLIIIVCTAVPIVVGLLLGLLRGSNRSILRLVLVLLCVVAAFFIKDVVTDKLMTAEVGEQTVPQIVEEALKAQSPEFAELGNDVVLPLIKSILNVFSFLMLFLILQFITWAILYPICKIFIKKGREVDGKVRKHGLIGLIVGAVQGVAVAFVLCVIFNGLLVNAGKVVAALQELQDSPSASTNVNGAYYAETEPGSGGTEESADYGQMLVEYTESGISKLYTTVGDGAFNLIARTTVVDSETQETKTVTLSGQISVLDYAVKMYKEINIISGLDSSNLTEFAHSIKDSFHRLGQINGDLPDEAKDTINKLVKTVLGSDSSPFDIGDIQFTDIDFAKEGDIIADLADISSDPSKITEESAKKIVNDVASSDLILPIIDSALEGSGQKDMLQLPDDKKEIARNEINKLKTEGVEQSKIDILTDIFGLNATNDDANTPNQAPAE